MIRHEGNRIDANRNSEIESVIRSIYIGLKFRFRCVRKYSDIGSNRCQINHILRRTVTGLLEPLLGNGILNNKTAYWRR